jgi:hypothetical protein
MDGRKIIALNETRNKETNLCACVNILFILKLEFGVAFYGRSVFKLETGMFAFSGPRPDGDCQTICTEKI